jgi:hypothetical protein
MSTRTAPLVGDRPSASGRSDLELVLQVLDGLVASAEPAVVFTSVTRLCVPVLCDAASATILTDDQQAYQTKWPWHEADPDAAQVGRTMAGRQLVSPNAVLTPIAGLSTEGGPAYQGVLALNFHTSSPSPCHAVLAQLVVERAVAVIERERLADLVTAQRAQADHLRIALASNRQIGAAIGILMASRKLTSEHAFDLLRLVSQHRHRKLYDVALEVVETGTVELPANLTRTPPANGTVAAVAPPEPRHFMPLQREASAPGSN